MERDLTEVAKLLVSEVVANAVVHGHAPITLVFEQLPKRLRIAVTDGGAHQPSLKQNPSHDEHGRGLMLIERLAADWGVIPGAPGHGKTVWFTLRTS